MDEFQGTKKLKALKFYYFLKNKLRKPDAEL